MITDAAEAEWLDEPEPPQTGPATRRPWLTPEVAAARQEDPGFAEILGRARAKARQEPYDPAKHHPYRARGRSIRDVAPEVDEQLQAVIQRFSERGARWRDSVPARREPAVETTRHLRAL